MMRQLAIVLVLLGGVLGCSKPATVKPVDDEPTRIEVRFGDCDGVNVTFVSGRPVAQPEPPEPPRSDEGSAITRQSTVSIGDATVKGELDKAIIRRYLKRNVAKVQDCYERQLPAKPKLDGTVTAHFTIKPDGAVDGATASGVDPEVAGCVSTVIGRIEFPKPPAGGSVQVSYPFVFHPLGTPRATAKPEPTALAPAKTTPPAKAEMWSRPAPLSDDPREARRQAIAAARSSYPGGDNPLATEEDALTACFRKAPTPHGVMVVRLTVSQGVTTVTVYGAETDGVRACVVDVAKKLKPPAIAPDEKIDTQCPLAFGTIPIAEARAIDIANDGVKLDGKSIATLDGALADASPRIALIFDAITIADTSVIPIRGPYVIRPVMTAPMKVVNRVLATLHAGNVDGAVAVERKPKTWAFPSTTFDSNGEHARLELPLVPVRDPPARKVDTDDVQLSILVTKATITIGVSRINEFETIPRDGKELARVAAVLKDRRQSAFFQGRADAEIAGDDAVTYGTLVPVIDAAIEAGFFDAAVTDPASLSAKSSD